MQIMNIHAPIVETSPVTNGRLLVRSEMSQDMYGMMREEYHGVPTDLGIKVLVADVTQNASSRVEKCRDCAKCKSRNGYYQNRLGI